MKLFAVLAEINGSVWVLTYAQDGGAAIGHLGKMPRGVSMKDASVHAHLHEKAALAGYVPIAVPDKPEVFQLTKVPLNGAM